MSNIYTKEDKIEQIEDFLFVAEEAKNNNRFVFEIDLGGLVMYEALKLYHKHLTNSINIGYLSDDLRDYLSNYSNAYNIEEPIHVFMEKFILGGD